MKDKNDNLITFVNKNKITEGEINSLFLGLVKFIKKMATEEAVANLPKDKKTLISENQNLELKISQKEREIDLLQDEIKNLRSKLKVKNLKILQLSCLSAKRLKEFRS